MGNRWLFIPAIALMLAGCGAPSNPFFPSLEKPGGSAPVSEPVVPELEPGADTAITVVHLTVTSPATGDVPDTAAVGHEADNYTIGTVSWAPDDAVFAVSTVYTAGLTLTAHTGYTFTGLVAATINGIDAIIDGNNGRTLTLSHTFAATLKTVTGIAIKTPPRLAYTHGDPFDLSGLEATLVHDDGTEEHVPFEDFEEYNISAEPENGMTLSHTLHDGLPVTVSFGQLAADTGSLTVMRAPITGAYITVTGPAKNETPDTEAQGLLPLARYPGTPPMAPSWAG